MLNFLIQQGLRRTIENVFVPIVIASIGAYAMIMASEVAASASMGPGPEPAQPAQPSPPPAPKAKKKKRSTKPKDSG